MNHDFFARLSRITGEPERILRTRLTHWSQGSRPKRPGLPSTGGLVVSGLGCVQCHYLKDGARFPVEVTQYHFVCLQHRTWTRSSDGSLAAGSPATPDVIRAAHRYKRARRHRHQLEVETAFNLSYHTFRKMVRSSHLMRLPALEVVWIDRTSRSDKPQPSVLEICYPEVAALSAVLLGNRCVNASRGLSGARQSPIATEKAQIEFGQMARGIFSCLTIKDNPTGMSRIAEYVQSTAITCLGNVLSRDPPTFCTPEEVKRMVAQLLRDRQEHAATLIADTGIPRNGNVNGLEMKAFIASAS